MNKKKIKLCRLCLRKILNKTSFERVKNVTTGMLDILLVKIDFAVTGDSLICNGCLQSIKMLFNFKSRCLIAEELINHYISKNQMLQVNLREMYLQQEKNRKSVIINQDHRVCRFCLQLYENIDMDEITENGCLMDILKTYYPELDLNSTDEITSCGDCFDSLIHHFNFVTNCLDTERIVKSYCKTLVDNTCKIDIKNVLEFTVKNENLLFSSKTDRFTTLKGNQKKCERANEINETKQLHVANFGMKVKEVVIKVELDDISRLLPAHRLESVEDERENTPCSNVTDNKLAFNKHPIEENPAPKPKILKCKPNTHMRTRAKSIKKIIYKCDKCLFQTKYKRSLKSHTFTHSNKSDVETFTCYNCTFQTRYKRSLTRHMLLHQSKSQLKLFKCDQCPYESKLKRYLTRHKVAHNTKLKCNQCSFTAKYKNNLASHSLMHSNFSETTIYKCYTCSFQTKYKNSLKTHMLCHRPLAAQALFKCELCEFTAKHKGNLKFHSLKHKNSSETIMYKCDKCNFETKYKISLKTHLLTHRKASDRKIEKCEKCSFKTWHKGNLKKHVLIHKNPSETKMYDCEICKFQTKYIDSFKVHMKNH